MEPLQPLMVWNQVRFLISEIPSAPFSGDTAVHKLHRINMGWVELPGTLKLTARAGSWKSMGWFRWSGFLFGALDGLFSGETVCCWFQGSGMCFISGDSPLTLGGLSMLYSIVGVGLNAMPMAAFQDALTNLLLDVQTRGPNRFDLGLVFFVFSGWRCVFI